MVRPANVVLDHLSYLGWIRDVRSLVTAWLEHGMLGARPLVMPRSGVLMFDSIH